LDTITQPDGASQSYTYDAHGYLSRVTRPGVLPNPFREYHYDKAVSAPAGGTVYLLTSIVDENAHTFASWDYDASGRPTLSVHGVLTSSIDRTTIAYPTVDTATVTDSLGTTSQFSFVDELGVRKFGSMTSPCIGCGARFHSQTYDPDTGLIDLTTDFNGNVTDYDYDSRGLETRRVDASSDPSVPAASSKRITETTWNANFRVPNERSVENASGTVESLTKWVYNTRGQTTARCQVDSAISGASAYTCGSSTNAPAGVRQTMTKYCESGAVQLGVCPIVGLAISVNSARLTTDTGMGGLDDITAYTYYQTSDSTCASGGACPHRKGDLWKVTDALGHVTEYVSYDKNGRATRLKDANGTYTDFTYHPRGWLTDRTVRASATGTPGAGDATMHIDYDAVGNVTQVTQPDGAWLAYTYDDAHRLIKIADNLANSIDYCPGGVGTADCLDAAGNRKVEQVKDPSNAVKRQLHRVYNQLGQLTQVLNAANAAVETSAGITDTGIADGYDGNGNRILKDDGLGIRTEQDVDPLNRLKTTIQNLAGTDTATQNTTTTYTYDTRDNLRQVTDPDGLNTVYDYDALDNLTGLHSPDTGTTSYTYDAAGNRISQTDNRTPSVTSTYTYDPLNRLTAIAYPTTSLNITYAYDQADGTTGCSGSFPKGRLTRMTDASGSTTYCYDRRGNVLKKTQMTDGATLVTQYTYTTADRTATIVYPSGGTATYSRDVLGHITSVTWTPSGARTSTLISGATYLPFGPLTTLTFGNGRTQAKTYDQDYAISAIQGTPTGALTLDFDVDVMGDITSASGTMNPSTPDRTYEYDSLYRLTAAKNGASPLEAYTYNKTGDRMSASLNGGAASAYTYTDNPPTHHLTSVGGVARTYDGNGNTLTGTLGVTGFTLSYDDRNRLATATMGTTVITNQYNGRGERVSKAKDINGVGLPPARYVYDEGGHLLADDTMEYIYLDSIPVGVVKGGVLYYIETDHLGTPRQVVKPTGNVVVWKWDFLQNTFGNSAPNQDPDGDSVQFVMGMRFPGQYIDAETGLIYNHFRDYESSTGRFVESDPIGMGGGLSTYGYVNESPLELIDPLGLVEHKSGRWIDCGADCWIRIDFTLDPNTNQVIRHLHWACNGNEGECGEFGSPSHGGTWQDAPRRIKECAKKHGFQGEPRPYAPPQPNMNSQPPDIPWWVLILLFFAASNPVTA
jgi:RHS repeat-associated protein